MTSPVVAADHWHSVADRPAVSLRGGGLAYGSRVLWRGLDLDIAPGEFLVVLGPNGSGKTSLLRVLLGLQPLTEGTVRIAGEPISRGNPHVGYVPQQKSVDGAALLRGRDLVGLAMDGHRWGVGLRGRGRRRRQVADAVAAVGASGYAHRPVGRLSGGEQQRLRVAQALVGDPDVLLCDEPLLSLDLAHQRAVAELIDTRRRVADTAVVFVTHEINPVLGMADRVLYLVDGRFTVGTAEEVMTSRTLSGLYRTQIEVLRVRDKLLVVGATGEQPHHLQDDDR
ncbi:MAG: metal ABC transporter ATP-binding protein [Sciscionella sp.]